MISVLIATYNREHFLDQCIQSVKNSTFKDVEIVLVDDGSTDDSHRFAKDVDVYLKTPHKGISNARNKAMMMASGDRFFILDSDDWIEPTLLEKVNQELDNGAAIAFSDLMVIDGDTKTPLKMAKQDLKDCIKGKKIPHGSMLFDWRKVAGQYDETLESAVDYDFLLQLLSSNPTLGHVEEPLYNYRRHQSQEWGSQRQLDADKKIKEKWQNLI